MQYNILYFTVIKICLTITRFSHLKIYRYFRNIYGEMLGIAEADPEEVRGTQLKPRLTHNFIFQ